jgi:hypothetical protein
MKDFGLDFGQLIAYLIPGFVAVGAIALCDGSMYILFNAALHGKDKAGTIVAVIVFSVAAGMIVSVARAAFVDCTFALSKTKFPWLYRFSSVTGILREDPNITAIARAGLLDALRDARAEDKRPYQFYGNLLISVLLLVPAWLIGLSRGLAAEPSSFSTVLYVMLLALVAPALYSASRRSHYRYMREIRRLNRAAVEARPSANGTR